MKSKPLRYEHRDAVLKRLGFESYGDYLKSDLWASIRSRVFDRDGGRCRGCGKKAAQVHHFSYGDVTMRGEILDRLISVCLRCHRKIEFKNGRKRSFSQSVQCTRAMLNGGFKKKARRHARHRHTPRLYDRPYNEAFDMTSEERRGQANAVLEFLGLSGQAGSPSRT